MIRILLATYNGEKYIDEMIGSILSQDYSNWQLVLSDDGSKDNTPAILEGYAQRYPEKIIHYKSGKRFGSACPHFLHLLEKWKDADYIMFCDQDDIWHSDKIRKTFELMKEIEAGETDVPTLIHTDLRVVDGELNEIAPSYAKYSDFIGSRMELEYTMPQNVVTGCTMMINKSLAMLGGSAVPKNTDDILMHDWMLAVLAAACGKGAFLDEPTIDYRQHNDNSIGARKAWAPSSIMQRLSTKSMIKSLYTTTTQVSSILETYGDLIPEKSKKLMKIYASLPQKGKLKRLSIFFKYHTWKYGLIRKITQTIFW